MQESFHRAWKLGSSMFCPQSSVFCPLKDRRVRFAHAGQKRLEVGKITEVEEKSTVNIRIILYYVETLTTNVLSSDLRLLSSARKLGLSMFCPPRANRLILIIIIFAITQFNDYRMEKYYGIGYRTRMQTRI
ncbi:hypothetical protein BES34_016505 [Leptospira inadai serovar Lyme]|uniref:Uncharacterized protein n=1 Tax=Leptospira inadai serovar Lyme TaxID=293084 RepID=A0ABX4YF36_9LEPT|nr:hypothetical protein BES34_016505 [Leptospira inadai serovar Lyme]